MTRMEDWQREAHEAVRREAWTLRGMNQVVKVVPLPVAGSAATELGGYITLGKFLLLKTPQQIEKALGLPHGYLSTGARVYRFTRLPQITEYEYDLTAQYPGGLAFHPGYSDPRFPPGSAVVHQWKINPGQKIPVDSKNYLDLRPGQPFPHSWLAQG